jgi:hypothetical protein
MTAPNETAVVSGEPAAEPVIPVASPDPGAAPTEGERDGKPRRPGDRLVDQFIHNLLAALAPWNT